MNRIVYFAAAALLLVHSSASAMLRDASIDHDLGGAKLRFESALHSHEGLARDLATARATARGAETLR